MPTKSKRPPKDTTTTQIRTLVHDRFGFEGLRYGQEESIRLILAGHDVLSVMPTGSGKSAIYQVAALLIDGPTVVVSPLIALQKDQVESIREKDVAEAAVLNSTLRVGERRETLAKLEGGELEFLFLSPEQIVNEETFARLKASPPSLFVIDEAHCISEWGHDFRPEYNRLGAVIEALGHPRVLALTATASPNVRDDITSRLGMTNARTVVRGFDRPNIWLGVEACPDVETKDRLLVSRLKEMERPAIVYAATRGATEELARLLTESGIKAGAYHGAMKKPDRDAVQDAFMADEVDVVVATNAFGMGVDKPNVRTVIHYDVSESIDAYYQEVGRSGRDGEPARAVLFYRPEDVGVRRAMASGAKLSESDVAKVAEEVAGRTTPVGAKDVAENLDMKPGKVKQVLNRLEEVGAVQVLPGGEVLPADKELDPAAAAEEAVHEHQNYRTFRLGRVQLMKDFAEGKDCRRRYVLNYFGEPFPDPCGHCDNCETGVVQKVEAQKVVDSDKPFPVKGRVRHRKWGEGVVMGYAADKLQVLFDTEGAKEMVLKVVVENGLVENA
ncbi:MAG TPA: RecQ family ATP-dependent DNA helicase [Humisphaera sp.]